MTSFQFVRRAGLRRNNNASANSSDALRSTTSGVSLGAALDPDEPAREGRTALTSHLNISLTFMTFAQERVSFTGPGECFGKTNFNL